MAWDDKAPTTAELQTAATVAPPSDSSDQMSWDALPPHPVEQDLISRLSAKLQSTGQDLSNSVSDVGLGAAQGATMGFADELQGAGQAGLNAIQTGQAINPLNADFMKKYREYQQKAAIPYKEAEDRSPLLYGAGNIMGSVAVAPAFGAAGLATEGGRAAVGAALKEGGVLAAGKTLGVEAAKDAAAGVIPGALYGAGTSQGGIDTPEGRAKLASDIKSGAMMGGAVGGTIGLASNAVPVAAQSASNAIGSMIDNMDSPLSRIIKKAYNYGADGVNLSDETTRNQFFNKPQEFASDFMDKLDKADQMYGKAIGDTIKGAENDGVQIYVNGDLDTAAKKISDYIGTHQNIELDTKSKDIIGRLLTQNGVMSPSEAQYLRQQLSTVSNKINQPGVNVDYPIRDALYNFQGSLKNAMADAVPGYADAAKNFANFRQNTMEQILSGSKDPQTTGIKIGDLRNPDNKLADKISQMVQGATVEGSGSRDQAGAFEILKQKLANLQQTNPEAFQAMGTNAQDMTAGLKDAADTDSMIAGLHKVAPNEGTGSAIRKGISGVAPTGKATMLGIANKAGLYGGKIVDALGTPLTLTKKTLFDLPLSGTKAIADHLASQDSPAIKNLGEALQKATANQDQVGKNAVLFSILQNPNTRKMLNLQDDNQ